LDIAAGVVKAIEDELVLASGALAPFGTLAPVPPLLELGDLLRSQVMSLSGNMNE